MKHLLLSLCVITVLFSCQKKESTLAPEAKAYIDEVVSLLEAKSINRKHIDWKTFRADVLAHAGKAANTKEAHAAVQYALQLLKDRHSSFSEYRQPAPDTGNSPAPATATVPSHIGYLQLSSSPQDEDEIEMYRQQLIQQIATQDKPGIKGWIVDVRGNNGGPLSPMLAAIAPVLGNGTVGYFIDTNDAAEPWISENGKILYGTTVVEDLYEFHPLKNSSPYVAVLTDTTTRGSGEAIAIAFKGRPKTRSFGTKTAGASSTNETYILSDGSALTLTTAVFADRNQQKYGDAITPDQVVPSDQALAAALQWLQKQ